VKKQKTHTNRTGVFFHLLEDVDSHEGLDIGHYILVDIICGRQDVQLSTKSAIAIETTTVRQVCDSQRCLHRRSTVPRAFDYTSDKGVTVTCQVESIKNDVAQNEIDSLVELLDDNKGETCRLYI
jgi:hypothetical protein